MKSIWGFSGRDLSIVFRWLPVIFVLNLVFWTTIQASGHYSTRHQQRSIYVVKETAGKSTFDQPATQIDSTTIT